VVVRSLVPALTKVTAPRRIPLISLFVFIVCL
jgi:hypothetical protein